MSTIFSNQNLFHLAELLFWLLGAFIIGFYFGSIGKSKKTKKKLLEENELSNHDSFDLVDDISKIRATKTFERGGKETVKSVFSTEPKVLDFNRIGTASYETKDDLKKITGIGTAIEEKLNEIGIFKYEQITNFTSQDIKEITDLIKFFPGRIERDDWVGQAYKLLNHKNK